MSFDVGTQELADDGKLTHFIKADSRSEENFTISSTLKQTSGLIKVARMRTK
jgi:hypothetical protein